jgi:hypothetical protein
MLSRRQISLLESLPIQVFAGGIQPLAGVVEISNESSEISIDYSPFGHDLDAGIQQG